MNLLNRLKARLTALFRKRRLDADMDDEMRSHIELRTQANIEAGMNPEEARFAALRQFGWTESIKEDCREQRGVTWLENLAQDVRYGARQLRKNPGFTAVAVLTLALCLGANLTIFAVIDSVLLRPLPFPDADRLVTMFNTYPMAGVERDGATLPNYYERRGNISAFSHISLLRHGAAIVGEAGSTEQIDVTSVSPEFFTTLGVGPLMGRAFTDEEMTYQTAGVAILTDGFWRQRFHADPNVLGRQLRVDGLSKTIVGVLPPGFSFLSSKARLYFPLASDPGDREARQRHSSNDYEMFARLKPGVAVAAAQAQIDAHNAAHAAEYPEAKMIADAGFRTLVTPLHADHVKAVRPTLLLMQAGVFFLFLIGGVNLVNLLLIRAGSRAKEMAIRQSLGASRRRVVRQVMTETILLAVIGGFLGLAVAAAGIRLLAVLGVDQLPLGANIAFDGRLALVAMLGAAVTGIIIAAPIAWFNLHAHLANALQSESRGGTSGHAAQRLRHGFIVAQLALAFVLLAGAGLLGLSLKRTMAVSPGFRPDHILTGQISLPWNNYRDWPPRLNFIGRLLEEVRRQPGVSAVGVINNVPFSGKNVKSGITVKGYVLQPGDSLRAHYFYGVGGDVFEALGIPLREGRFVDNTDSDSRVCVVDEDFARHYWPKGGAIGRRLFVGANEGDDATGFTVVGVVGAMKQAGLTEDQAQGAVYSPFKYRTDVNFFAVVRTSQRPESFGPALRGIVRTLDPELPVNDLRPMEVRIADSLLARRSSALLAGIFAAVALLLTAIGTYGVLAYAVAQRRREIGVRMALGALPVQIGWQFLQMGLRLLAIGTVVGAIGAGLAGQAMQSVLFNVPALPLGAFAGIGILLIVVSLLACWLPARRAAKVDPMVALRHE
jgi:predicted permease